MIYLDNAATTFPKPSAVISESIKCIKKYCANPGRSSHNMSIKTAEKIYETRERISDFLGVPDKSDRVVFTENASYALNFAIKSTIKPGKHVLISDIEHNSVLRPIFSLYRGRGIEYSTFDSSDIENSIRQNIRSNTKYIVSTLASNVTGREIPLYTLSKLAREYNLTLIVDASQEIGHKAIDLSKTPCDVLCAPGHKALFGLAGCGFLIFNDDLERDPLIEGGSGNMSLSTSMPENLPERFEAGTLPCPSIISLNEGLKFIEKITLEEINSKIESLSSELYARLEKLPKISLYGYGNGVLPFNIGSLPSEAVAEELNRDGICTRAGLHCAPSVHKLLGTLKNGAIRVSFSYFNSKRDVDLLYKSVKRIIGTI